MQINKGELGINRALFAAGLGDHRPGVLKSHVDAAHEMELAGIRSDVEVVGWRSGNLAEKKSTLKHAITQVGRGGIVFASSGAGALTALLAVEEPDLFADKGAVLLASRVRRTPSLVEVKSPLLREVVADLADKWPHVPSVIQARFVTTRPQSGDVTVTEEESELLGAFPDVFPYDAVDHLDGINHMLTLVKGDDVERIGENNEKGGLERTIFLPQKILVNA
jgi:hypothetical protein